MEDATTAQLRRDLAAMQARLKTMEATCTCGCCQGGACTCGGDCPAGVHWHNLGNGKYELRRGGKSLATWTQETGVHWHVPLSEQVPLKSSSRAPLLTAPVSVQSWAAPAFSFAMGGGACRGGG